MSLVQESDEMIYGILAGAGFVLAVFVGSVIGELFNSVFGGNK